MNLPRSVRVLIAMAVLVLSLAALLLMLTISEATLNIQAHLRDSPRWLKYGWWGLLATFGPADRLASVAPPAPRAPNRSKVRDMVFTAPYRRADRHGDGGRPRNSGADTAAIRNELAELRRRRDAGEIHVAMFGEISTGKSALVTCPAARCRDSQRRARRHDP